MRMHLLCHVSKDVYDVPTAALDERYTTVTFLSACLTGSRSTVSASAASPRAEIVITCEQTVPRSDPY